MILADFKAHDQFKHLDDEAVTIFNQISRSGRDPVDDKMRFVFESEEDETSKISCFLKNINWERREIMSQRGADFWRNLEILKRFAQWPVEKE